MYTTPPSPEILILQAVTVVALSFAARGIETVLLMRSDIEDLYDDTGKKIFKVTFERAKRVGPKVENYALITGQLECKVMQTYLNSFPPKYK